MTIEEFSSLPPFQGRVTKVEKIPHEPNYQLRSVSGPDVRVTIERKDGTTMVVKRVHTIMSGADNLKRLTTQSVCTLPDDVVKCADLPPRENVGP